MIDAYKILRLKSGGSLELKVTGDFFLVSDADRDFILSLGKIFDDYRVLNSGSLRQEDAPQIPGA